MGLIKPGHVYSYSQLSSLDECAYSYYLQRIEKVPNLQSSAFAERGSLIHDILDQWGKGLLDKEHMLTEYEKRYASEVVTAFPSMMKGYAAKAYQQGVDFLTNFDEFRGYKIVSTEEKFTIDLPLANGETRKFTGIVDMILRKEWTDELIICDHKSKSMDAFKKAANEMYRQQYLYAQYVFEQYGEWPKYLMFHLFNAGGEKPYKPFDLKEFRETLVWATDCINKIESNTTIDWLEYKDSSDFFCNSLCSVRGECPKGSEKPMTKKEKEAEKERLKQWEIEQKTVEEIIEEAKEETQEEIQEEVKKCENCGEPYVKGKRKCPHCKAWYKERLK